MIEHVKKIIEKVVHIVLAPVELLLKVCGLVVKKIKELVKSL
jgi:hypothetical protein